MEWKTFEETKKDLDEKDKKLHEEAADDSDKGENKDAENDNEKQQKGNDKLTKLYELMEHVDSHFHEDDKEKEENKLESEIKGDDK